MDFANFNDNSDLKRSYEQKSDIDRIKTEFEEEDRIFHQELQLKDALLDKFELDQLKQLCLDLLGREPDPEYFEVETGKKIELPCYRNDYIHFIIDELRLFQIRDYAIKNKIISPGFFDK